MSRSLRAQVSLIFTDEDLYDNFLTPLKENKELSGMIVKLLSAYYNSEEVRNMVEGVSLNDMVEGSENIIDSTEAINNMRQTLAMQDFLYEQVKQTLDEGASEMETLLKATDIAKQSGVVKTESTDVGEALGQFKLEDSTLGTQNRCSTEPTESTELEGRINRMEEAINQIMSVLQSGQVVQTSTQSTVAPIQPIYREEAKTESLSSVAQVPLVEKVEEQNLVAPTTSSQVMISEEESITEDEVNKEVKEEDASDELKDVLGDLLS